jgi:hypothetical protein
MPTTYNPKSRIVIVVDDVNASPFDSTARRTLGAFSKNIISCDWTYEPASGGIKDASVKLRLPRGSSIREAFAGGRFGLVSIYRTNHLAELPLASGFVDVTQNFDNNERSYLLFQGVAENASAEDASDSASFKVKGLGSWLKELEYTGTFTDTSVGQIFTAVMTDVIARSNQPIKSFTTEDMTLTGVVPNSFHVLHRKVAGTIEYKNVKVSKILKDLQDATGGTSAVTFGVRCGATSDNYGEAYLLVWRGEGWTPEYQEDASTLDAIAPIPYTRVAKYETESDTSGIVNSVEVYGAPDSTGLASFTGSATSASSIKEFGLRHETVTNSALLSNKSCENYAAQWLAGRSSGQSRVALSWSDEQTLNDSQRVGGSTLAKPHDVLHYMRDMNSMLHVTNESSGDILLNGEYSDQVGIDGRPTAIKLSKVASGNPSFVTIDTTLAPFYGTDWGDTNVFGNPNKEIALGQFVLPVTEPTRSMLSVIRYGIPDPSAALDGRVLCEWSKKLRLKIKQSGGAGAAYGFTIESYRGSVSGWVDELAGGFGIFEVLPATHGSTDGGACVAIELQGIANNWPLVNLWSDYAASGATAWTTLLSATNVSGASFGDATNNLYYNDLLYQTEDFIALGAGTTSGGAAPSTATSGNWEIYGMRCYEGEFNATTSEFEYGRGLDAEGSSTTDKAGSFLYQEAFSHLPRIEYSAGRLMTLEPSFKKTVSGNDYHFVKWTRAQLDASGAEIYDGFSNDGYHARLYFPQTGDGLVVGDGVTTATNWETTTGMRSSTWRVGSTGDYSKRLGLGVSIPPTEAKFKYAGEHSPLSISVKGGTSGDSLARIAEDTLQRVDSAERDANTSL